LVENLVLYFLFKNLWDATVFPHVIFLFFYEFFLKLSLSILFFLYWTGWEFSFVVFFFKTMWITTVFPHMIVFFVMILVKIIFINFMIFNIELLIITILNFLMKRYKLLQCFPALFFLWFFSKLSLLILFF